MSQWVADGNIKVHEDFVVDLEIAPRAFIGLLEDKNFGKLIVRLAQD
jgi:NADPH-dependent curcumin reductase CurA